MSPDIKNSELLKVIYKNHIGEGLFCLTFGDNIYPYF